jgi:hypothetical protein
MSLWNLGCGFVDLLHGDLIGAYMCKNRRRYQESWTLKHPWCQQDPNGIDNFERVKCISCSRVNGHGVLLDAKGDNLRKHGGWTTVKCDKLRLKKKNGESWMNPDSKHKKAEWIYLSLPVCNIQTIIAQGNPPKRKEVQMAIVFHLLSFGRPMLEYEHMRGLLQQLGYPKLPLKH